MSTLAESAIEGYQLIIDKGYSPKMIADFVDHVMAITAAAYTNGVENNVAVPMQDDSVVMVQVIPGQAPTFSFIEKVHSNG